MSGYFEVVIAAEAPAEFATCRASPEFAALELHPYRGGFARVYYPAVYGETYCDQSFAVTAGGRPVALFECDLTNGVLGRFSAPLNACLVNDAEIGNLQKLFTIALEHILNVAGEGGAAKIMVCDQRSEPFLSPLAKVCLDRAGLPHVRLRLETDLIDGESGIRKGLRKSFKSLINWGRRAMTLGYVNADSADRGAFEAYRDFHARVAGGVTRPGESWDAMYDWIVAGRGELVLGYLEDNLVSGVMVVDGSEIAAYASGVYDRELFDKPLAHWPLYCAMIRSGERGLRLFDLGDFPVDASASDKERNIGYFKRGFAGRIVESTVWAIALADAK